MRKAIIVAILLAVIVLTFSNVILRLLANGAEDNFFNQKYREKFASYPLFRKSIGLHFDGDAKKDYLGTRYKKIVVEVDEMEGLSVSFEALDIFSQKIRQATGKEVQIVRSDKVPFDDDVTDAEISEIVKKYRNVNFIANSAYIYFLYLSEFDDNIDHLGSTYQENGILLFDFALRNFTSNSPKTLDNYVESTALHEFGHQIGLGHNQQPGCLMNEQLEQAYRFSERPVDVITDFCEYEKQLIQVISKK